MKVASLFSGIGGFDLGFVWAGHEIIWANDIWQDAVESYKMNIGKHIVCKDVKLVDANEIPESDIIIGGFPCQGFSVANQKRHTEDERNTLYLEFVRILKEKQPPFFIAENVKGILSLGKGSIFQMILKDFSEIGYDVKHALLNAADFGVPQRRERVFIFGTRKNVQLDISFPPETTHHKLNGKPFPADKEKWVGVGKALAHIPEPEAAHDLKNHEASKYKLRFNGYLGHRVINPELPCPTITARGDSKGGVVVHHHPNNHRRISPREAAVIQSFPLDFQFYGKKTSVYRQVGNAVPPKLAHALAQLFPITHDEYSA